MHSSIINLQRQPLSRGASIFSMLLLTAHFPSIVLSLKHSVFLWKKEFTNRILAVIRNTPALLCSDETAPAHEGICTLQNCALNCGCEGAVIRQWHCLPENLLCLAVTTTEPVAVLDLVDFFSFYLFFFGLYKPDLSTPTYFTNKSHSCCDTKVSMFPKPPWDP